MGPDLSLIGFPYGSTGTLTSFGGWVLSGSSTSPIMSTGPDLTTDWIQASAHNGDHRDHVKKDFTAPTITTDFTVEFTYYYQPTTGAQFTFVEFDDLAGGHVVVGLQLKYTGTGAGSLTTAEIYDNGATTGLLTAIFLPGIDNRIKLTYDGTYVRLFVNNAPQITWPHVLDFPGSDINHVDLEIHWVTGFGGDIFLKDMELHPGVL